MKQIVTLFFFFFVFGSYIFASDTTTYSVKYRYTRQKDSMNSLSKANDIMMLTISNKYSVYYSYLKQLGYKNEGQYYRDFKDEVASGGTVAIQPGSAEYANFFISNETEIIAIDYLKKQSDVTDKLLKNVYGYSENLDVPIWNILPLSSVVLGEKCQAASTIFRGRNYTAWFTKAIPFSMGPWLFNGLPGLILKVSDDKGQFDFECIELNSSASDASLFKPYENVKKIDKGKLKAKKRLKEQNYIAFLEAEEGVTVTVTGSNGANEKPKANKPYNPIELTP